MNQITISLRDGLAVDRAQTSLAHAIAIVNNNDWQEAQEMAADEMRSAWHRAVERGLRGARLALQVIADLDRSRDTLPV